MLPWHMVEDTLPACPGGRGPGTATHRTPQRRSGRQRGGAGGSGGGNEGRYGRCLAQELVQNGFCGCVCIVGIAHLAQGLVQDGLCLGVCALRALLFWPRDWCRMASARVCALWALLLWPRDWCRMASAGHCALRAVLFRQRNWCRVASACECALGRHPLGTGTRTPNKARENGLVMSVYAQVLCV